MKYNLGNVKQFPQGHIENKQAGLRWMYIFKHMLFLWWDDAYKYYLDGVFLIM